MLLVLAICLLASVNVVHGIADTAKVTLKHKETIREGLSPKSVVYNGNGLFFAQNMMYRHTVTVYNREFELIKTIRDRVKLEDYGIEQYGEGLYRGAPVEAAFSHSGAYAWITNYQMYGDSMTRPGCDGCKISQDYDKSFVYKINTSTFDIMDVIEVGSVPKYIATTPNNKYVLVSNWSSGDLSVIDIAKTQEIKRIKLGRYPRGIAIDSRSQFAYVAIMGSTKIAKIDLADLSVSWFDDIGATPRHLCIDNDNKYLYCSLNNSGKIAKIDVTTGAVIDKVRSGRQARSMVLSSNGKYAYTVNYSEDSISKIDTERMVVVEKHKTKSKPIGITFDDRTNNVWVACYSGSLMVFEETAYSPMRPLHLDVIAQTRLEDRGTVLPGLKYRCFRQEDYQTYIGGSVEIEAVTAEEEVPELIAEEQVIEEEVQTVEVAPAVDIVETEVEEVPVVEVAVVKESPKAVAGASGSFYIIGGSFNVKSHAENFHEKLLDEGYQAHLIKRSNGTHLVAFGSYPTESAAEKALVSIRQKEEKSAWIYNK